MGHRPSVPNADYVFLEQYHDYMQAAATRFYESQQRFKDELSTQKSTKKPDGTLEAVSNNNQEPNSEAPLSEKSAESQDSSGKYSTSRKGKPSRLPPPIPPPPELRPEAYFDALFMEYGHTEQLKQQMIMSPDVSSNSESMHKVQIQNHLQSLMNVYKPKGNAMAMPPNAQFQSIQQAQSPYAEGFQIRKVEPVS